MRLRNIPGADEFIEAHADVLNDAAIYQGRWLDVFGGKGEIHIEIGMGKGQFLLQLAECNPNINYIGIERYSSVLLRAMERYDIEGLNKLQNIKFLCENAMNLPDIFGRDEVDRIYLNFSDPWPKAKHARRRLTSRVFLERYEKVLKADGIIEFKTDNRGLFDFSIEEARAANWKICAVTYDLHRDETMKQGNIMTEYEEKFSGLGNPIYKLVISLH
ncbi:MAG: tRNA (guanosine(46)-N7)-methyltransferase TrmB [Lachnospiraceae bacterium]